MLSLWNDSAIIKDDIKKDLDYFFKNTILENGLEYRQSQYQISQDILSSFLNKRFRIIEAGVGIGKTIAYLVPSMLMSYKLHKTIIVSTSTIPLEEQLERDFKSLKKLLKMDGLESVIVKGKRK